MSNEEVRKHIQVDPSGNIKGQIEHIKRIDIEDVSQVTYLEKKKDGPNQVILINFTNDGTFTVAYAPDGTVLSVRGNHVEMLISKAGVITLASLK